MQELTSKALIDVMRQETTARVGKLILDGVDVHLGVVLVGADEMSIKYVEAKSKAAQDMGIIVSVYQLDEGCEWSEVVQSVDYLASDPEVHGVIVQLPVPGDDATPENLEALFAHIPFEKDVDGLRHAWEDESYDEPTYADIARPRDAFLPPMVASVITLLESYSINAAEGKVVIVGNGMLVGKPLSAYFDKIHVPVKVIDEETEKPLDIAVEADLLIAGTGQENLITYQWVKPNAVVLDCANDVHRESVDQVASAVSPARGGLGPLTVQWVLRNTLIAAEQQAEKMNT